MNRTSSVKYKWLVASAFSVCARTVALSGADAVCDLLHKFEFLAACELSPLERETIASFHFSAGELSQLERYLTRLFLDQRMGFKQLFDRAYRSAAQIALHRAIVPYSKESRLTPLEFYQRKYLPLFEALVLPYSLLLRVDGNLWNNMPRSPVRSKRVRSPGQEILHKTR